MGTWFCLCAFCAGPLHDTRRVTREDADSDDSFDGESYDPELIRESEWMDNVRCLGINTASKEPYISGKAEPTYNGQMYLYGDRDDPNQPEGDDDDYKNTYYVDDEKDGHVFPFHEMCYNMLKDIIISASGEKNYSVDRLVLFWAMCHFVCRELLNLNIEGVQFQGTDQDWEEYEGEEFKVAKPAFLDGVQAAIVLKLLDGSLVPRDGSGITSSQRTVSDPFRILSQDLIFRITHFLPVNDILALSTASWPFLVGTSSNSLWKSLLHREMPWAADKIDELMESTFEIDSKDKKENQGLLTSKEDQESCKSKATSVDYKRLMLWLDHVVKPNLGVGAPWVYLANRRRIWRVCQIIANKYWEELGERKKEDFSGNVQEWPDSLLGQKYKYNC